MPTQRKRAALLFDERMSRAIGAGHKTQCRRIIKPQPPLGTTRWYSSMSDSGNWMPAGDPGEQTPPTARWQACPYGKPGDTMQLDPGKDVAPIKIMLLAVRIERLQGISESDARASAPGFDLKPADHWKNPRATQREIFEFCWTSFFGVRAWNANPWVWVVDFHLMT